jgi:pyridoxamine 5'-phosphate oxidase
MIRDHEAGSGHMVRDPIDLFRSWWARACEPSPLRQPNAVCVSTIGGDGFPSGRFVDLKSFDAAGLVFCTDLGSRKALEIAADPRVAVTVWWDHVGLQVRVQGIAGQVAEHEARGYWAARSRHAQLTTVSSRQSTPLAREEDLRQRLAAAEARFDGVDIPMPATWGAYRVRPVSIEFLEFVETRMHRREVFALDEHGAWEGTLLQP